MMSEVDPIRPWDSIRNLQREAGRLFETFEPWTGLRLARPFPSVNLYDAVDRFILMAELPGLAADEVDLSITGETLTLRGDRRRAVEIPEESYRRQERPFGRWSRSLTLPERIDGERISADLSNGILTVTLPKAAEPRPQAITVSASASASASTR